MSGSGIARALCAFVLALLPVRIARAQCHPGEPYRAPHSLVSGQFPSHGWVGLASIVPWADPTADRPFGTVLIGEGNRDGLMIHEWDLRTSQVVRSVLLSRSRKMTVVVLERTGDFLHVLVGAADGVGPITYVLLDAALNVRKSEVVGTGISPSLASGDGLLAFSWLAYRGHSIVLHVTTFESSSMRTLATRDVPFTLPFAPLTNDAGRTGQMVFDEGKLVILSGREMQTNVTAYNPRTLDTLSRWVVPLELPSLGRAHGLVAVLHDGSTLTELTDTLQVAGEHSFERGCLLHEFVEEPGTGNIIAEDGTVLFPDGQSRKRVDLHGAEQMFAFHGRLVFIEPNDSGVSGPDSISSVELNELH